MIVGEFIFFNEDALGIPAGSEFAEETDPFGPLSFSPFAGNWGPKFAG